MKKYLTSEKVVCCIWYQKEMKPCYEIFKTFDSAYAFYVKTMRRGLIILDFDIYHPRLTKEEFLEKRGIELMY